MKDLWVGISEEDFGLLLNAETIDDKRNVLSATFREADMDYSHQRELILDQLYSTALFTAEMEFGYEMTQSLLKLVVDEFGALMETEYDYGAERRLRDWINCHVHEDTIIEDAPKLKRIAHFVATTMFGELEAYHYALTHLPQVQVKRVPLYVDTPLRHLPPLS